MIKHYKIFANPSSHNLPSAYQEIEYLESTRTQYIDTGIVPTISTNFDIYVSWNYGSGLGGEVAMGVRDSSKAFMLSNYRTSAVINPSATNNGYCRIGNSGATGTIALPLVTNTKHHITCDASGYVYLDESRVYSQPLTRQTPPQSNIYLFRCNALGETSDDWFSGRIYGFVLTDTNNTKISELVPCYRKSDSVAGMYDLVSNTFLTNSGTGSFIVGPDVSSTILIPTYKRAYILNNTKISTYKSARVLSRLPSAYQEVEYLQSNGAQYIDTGLIPSATSFGWEQKLEFLDWSTLQVSHGSGEPNSVYCYGVMTQSGATGNSLGGQWSNYYYRNPCVGIKTEIVTMTNGTAVLKLDNYTNTISYDASKIPSTYSIYVFCAHYKTDVPNYYSTMKLYYLKFTKDGSLVRDFVPCYRKSDSVAGMYDLVSHTFFTNQGTGSFIVGPNTNIIIS